MLPNILNQFLSPNHLICVHSACDQMIIKIQKILVILRYTEKHVRIHISLWSPVNIHRHQSFISLTNNVIRQLYHQFDIMIMFVLKPRSIWKKLFLMFYISIRRKLVSERSTYPVRFNFKVVLPVLVHILNAKMKTYKRNKR